MSAGNTLEELHRFFEDDPDDYQLEIHAEARLKSLYTCLVDATSRTMLQIGLTGLLSYVKASRRSVIIDELLNSKDYISEIITIAADHFSTAPFLSATCLYECMLNYPKKFSPFLINKFRPMLPRIIYKKILGPSEISCKCLAQLSVLGITSSSKQAKSWKLEYERYLKIASLLIDQLYSGINDVLCSDVNDTETALAAEIGDLVSTVNHAAIFSNCCSILRNLLHVQLDSPVTVPFERTFALIRKVISINHQQFNLLHRKQHLPDLLGPCLQLCDSLVAFNPSSCMFHLRSLFTSIISLLDIVRPQVEYMSLSKNIYQLLTNLFAIYQRQVRLDVDVLQKLIRWLINDTTMRVRSKIPATFIARPDHHLCRLALNCSQQLLNIYSDHMTKDQYTLIQNHFVQTLISCHTASSNINKPYDDEFCRVGLYNTFECLLLNERADCPTIIAISKDLIDNAMMIDSSINVKMAVRKLKLVWQQVHNSSNHCYQAWSFITVEKARTTISNHVDSPLRTNELHHIFGATSAPVLSNIPTCSSSSSISMMNIDQPSVISKPVTYQPSMEPVPNMFHPPTVSYTSLDSLPKSQSNNNDPFVQPMKVMTEQKEEYIHESEQPAKRAKLLDSRPVRIDDDDDDGAEQIFADHNDDDEEMDESDEVDDDDDDDRINEEDESDISSEEDDDPPMIHTNGLKKFNQHLNIHQSNIDLLGIDGPTSHNTYLKEMNDNLHKKFRRPNHSYPDANQSSEDDSPQINSSHLPSVPMQLNGNYKSNPNKLPVGNGQNSVNTGVNNHDDDDDIVLVSDDDSGEKKINHISPAVQMDKSMMKSPPVITNPLYTKDLLEGDDRIHDASAFPSIQSNCSHLETSSIDDSSTSMNLAVQETMESLRDAITLVSDDYTMSQDNEQK